MKTAEEYSDDVVKLWNKFDWDEINFNQFKNYVKNYIEQAQKEAYNQALIDRDNYAMEFAKWVESLSPSDRVSVWSKDGSLSGLFYMDMEQLLCKYKSKLMK